MKFTIERNILLAALQRISNAVMTYKRANALGAYLYRNFIFHADLDELTIEASDREVVMIETVSIGNPDAEKKVFAIEAGPLLKAVKSLDGQSLEFEILEYQVIVKHTTGRFALPLDERVLEYDAMRKAEVNYNTAHYLKLEAPGIKSILERCAYAVAQDKLRPVMNGVCLNLTNDYADFAASDGHKLIRIRKTSIKTDSPAIMVIPKIVVSILRKITPNTGFVEIWFNDYKFDWPQDDLDNRPPCACRIVVENTVIIFVPVQGRYPAYNTVIPEDHFTRFVTVSRQALIKSIDRLSLFGNESTGLITVNLTAGRMYMSSEDKDFSTSADEEIPCSFDGQEPIRIGFKDYSLLQTLRNLNTTEVTFKIQDQTRAIIINPAIQPESEEITALLMPMLIND